jgi:hypothetical protein
MLVGGVNHFLPRLSVPILNSLGDERPDCQFVVPHIVHKICCSHELSNFKKLILVVISLEHGILLKDHVTHCAPQRPYVETIVVGKIIYQKFWAFIISRGHSHIIWLLWDVVLGKTPVNDSKLSLLMVYHDVMRLNVSMHDPHRVTVVKPFQNLINVKPAVEVGKIFVQLSMAQTVDSLEDEGGHIGHIILYTVIELDDVRSPIESL